MSYRITYEPMNRVVGVAPKTVYVESADKAWLEVAGLMNSDERVHITENGLPISWEELRDRANNKAS